MRFYRTSVIYLHHEGQFRSQDTDTKIQAKYGQKLFLDSRHSVSLMYVNVVFYGIRVYKFEWHLPFPLITSFLVRLLLICQKRFQIPKKKLHVMIILMLALMTASQM